MLGGDVPSFFRDKATCIPDRRSHQRPQTHPLTEQIGMNDYTSKYSARRDGSFTQHIVYGWCRATPKSIITCWVFIQDRQRFKSRHIVGSIAYAPRVFWFGCMPIVWGVAAADVRVEVPTHKKWCLCIICVNTVVTRECCLQNLIRRRVVLREEIMFFIRPALPTCLLPLVGAVVSSSSCFVCSVCVGA